MLYDSRLNNERNLAVYDRAVAKLASTAAPLLIERRAELAAILNDFNLAIP